MVVFLALTGVFALLGLKRLGLAESGD